MNTESEIQLWRRVDKSPDHNGCWVWTGAKSSRGHPKFKVGLDLPITPYRYIYEASGGKLEVNRPISQTCHNRLCVNPEHFDLKKNIVPLGWEDRFWEKVNKTDGCWLWTAKSKTAGYGQFNAPIKGPSLAHRVAYEIVIGPIPDGQVLDHKCHNILCVRPDPDHVRPITQKQNVENRGNNLSANNTSGVHGVYFHKLTGKWHARVKHNYIQYNLGLFVNLDDAADAVHAKRLELFTHNEIDQ